MPTVGAWAPRNRNGAGGALSVMAASPKPAREHRVAEEQAALRRVAALVTRAALPGEVFAAVTREAGRLLGADQAMLGRYDPGVGTTGIVWFMPSRPNCTTPWTAKSAAEKVFFTDERSTSRVVPGTDLARSSFSSKMTLPVRPCLTASSSSRPKERSLGREDLSPEH